MKDGLSSWCADCHNAAKRRARVDSRVRALVEEAAQYEREADAAPREWQVRSLRATAEKLRHEAEVERWRAEA